MTLATEILNPRIVNVSFGWEIDERGEPTKLVEGALPLNIKVANGWGTYWFSFSEGAVYGIGEEANAYRAGAAKSIKEAMSVALRELDYSGGFFIEHTGKKSNLKNGAYWLSPSWYKEEGLAYETGEEYEGSPICFPTEKRIIHGGSTVNWIVVSSGKIFFLGLRDSTLENQAQATYDRFCNSPR